jgi:membrane associated rhomboid family serine protease
MHEAAVGFQCPDCVKEGRKSMRAAQAPYGGMPSANPALTSLVLIGMNAAVWVAILVTGWNRSDWVRRLGIMPQGQCRSAAEPGSYYPEITSGGFCRGLTQGDGVWFPGVLDGAWWQMLSSAFTHVQPWHIGINMLVLWFIGPQLERVLGRVRFLMVYLCSAVVASVFVFWFSAPHSLTVGASGAIFGMLGAMLVIGWKIKADVNVLLIWLAIIGVITFTIPNVSWQGHLGGFVGGALVAALLVFAPRERRALLQWSGIAGLLVVLLVATLVRALILL